MMWSVKFLINIFIIFIELKTLGAIMVIINYPCNWLSEWVIKFNELFEDIGQLVVHTSRVIMAYTLESSSSLT